LSRHVGLLIADYTNSDAEKEVVSA